jgi:hypothetical protein
MLQNLTDLIRMKEAVGMRKQPFYAGFEKMREHPFSQKTLTKAGPFEEIGRNPTINAAEFDRDSNAAYQCALMWCITGDGGFASTTIDILNSWSRTLKKISGADAVLCAGLGGFKIANAAELMRCSNSGWPMEDAESFGLMLRKVFLPVIENFAPYANGNWDGAALKMMMAIAIYTNDRFLFDRALVYYRFGPGDGSLSHYIYPSGQCQESGRDQQHTQLGIAHMGDCCEMAWHQGLDLYSSLDNRLLLGFEYTAKYLLGQDVPFRSDVDQTGKYRHEAISERSVLRAVYEQIYNHYVNRCGISAPWTQRAAERLRPEGQGFGADHTGFGTLLYSREAGSDVSNHSDFAVPSGLHVIEDGGGLRVDFVPLSEKTTYLIKRRDATASTHKSLKHEGVSGSYIDRRVKAGRLYTYTVEGEGSRRMSSSVSGMPGLSAGWEAQVIGRLPGENRASFDGAAYRLKAGGTTVNSAGPEFLFAGSVLPRGSALTARVLPLIASQFLEMGLLALNEHEKVEAQLRLSPRGRAERPLWRATMVCGMTPSGTPQELGEHAIDSPTVTFGRLVEALWLRLERKHQRLTASISTDNYEWIEIASLKDKGLELRAGLFLNSGIQDVGTEVVFDNVTVSNG